MEIRFKTIEEERTEDAPFIGTIISSIGCKIKCKGCCNRELKKLPTLTESSASIIGKVMQNPFVEGIILGGLEWSEQPYEMIDLMKVAYKAGLKLMIYTGHDFNTFHQIIGQAFVGKYTPKVKMPKELPYGEFLITLGGIILDEAYPDDFYIKVGSYDREKLLDNNTPFGVKLASSNQTICLIKKGE